MSRSSWKPLFLSNEFVNQKNLNNEVYLYNRATVITKQMLGLRLHIYNGIKFYSITISSDMIGHSVGEFLETNKKNIIKKKIIKKKK